MSKKSKKRNAARGLNRGPAGGGGSVHAGGGSDVHGTAGNGAVYSGNKVLLSQCMIVKNEERNIEKALSWGRGIVHEQIVVDTGSTDRTVEIAEQMGARVLHFEWINDFAAAKNFAIDAAGGNWIAFLDADEYIEPGEAGNVIPLLRHIMGDAVLRKKYLAVNCPWIQLNELGQPKEVLEQERIFRNLPTVRYIGKIHECLSLEPKDVVRTEDFRIMHTGYTGEAFLTTGKAERNVELIRDDLRQKPDDIALKGYLAESLRAAIAVGMRNAKDNGTEYIDGGRKAEMEALYKEVIESNEKIPSFLRKGAYEYFINDYIYQAGVDIKLDGLCEKAYNEFPSDYKFICFYAMALYKRGERQRAYEILLGCEDSLNAAAGAESMLTVHVMNIFARQMILAAQSVGDVERVLRYAEIILLSDKTNTDMLTPYIATLVNNCGSIEEALGRLAGVYNLHDKADLLLITRTAKECGAIALAMATLEMAGAL